MWLSEPELSYGDEANAKDTAAIAKAVMGYRWATPNDGRRFLGWLVASLVGRRVAMAAALAVDRARRAGQDVAANERTGTDHGQHDNVSVSRCNAGVH